MNARTASALWLPLLVLLGVLGVDAWQARCAPCAVDREAEPLLVVAPEGITGRYEIRGHRRVLTLWGTPRERGYAHGWLLAESIVRGIEHDFDSVLKPFIPAYESVVRRGVVPKFGFNAREVEEMQGLYDGLVAKLPPEKRFVKGLDRAFDLTDIKALNTFGDWYGLGCSSLAVWGELTQDGDTLVGRNFDFPGFYLLVQHQHVVVRPADGDAAGHVGVSYPGCIGITTGMNAGGVFVAVHDVRIKPSLDKAMRPNVPRLLAVRRILEQTRGPEACTQAAALARTWPTLYGNNLMIVAPGVSSTSPRAAVLEYDCRLDMDGGCTMRIVDTEGAQAEGPLPGLCLTCTNHHRARAKPDGYADLYPRWRFPLLSDVDDLPAGPLDVRGLFAHMNRVSFPRKGTQQLATDVRGPKRAHGTLHQVVGEPGKARMHVRLISEGTHIRAVRPESFDVPAVLRRATR